MTLTVRIWIFLSLAPIAGCGNPYAGKQTHPKSEYDDMWGKQLPNDKKYEDLGGYRKLDFLRD